MKDQSNIIPFPKPQAAPATQPTQPLLKKSVTPQAAIKFKFNPSLATTVCSLMAIALATGVSNTSYFKKNEGWIDVASIALENRGIASVEPMSPELRNAAWEKSLAESLASTEVRDLASVAIGRPASEDEQVRFGVLERKYTILRDLKRNEVESITLQGSGSEPSLVLNRQAFLGQFGHWISEKYGAAKLKSSEVKNSRRYEAFTVYDKEQKAFATARFELDNYQRLLSFHLEPM